MVCPTTAGSANAPSGFTLIELLVVMAIMATLLSIVAPRYFESVDKAKEAALKTNLRILRDNIDKYKADNGHYPETLAKLAEKRYILSVPIDPMTDRADTWVLAPPPQADAASGVYDVHSGSKDKNKSGSAYATW